MSGDTTKGRVICQECGGDMGPAGTERNSHGLHPKCADKAFERLNK
jgi:hypothetical protein